MKKVLLSILIFTMFLLSACAPTYLLGPQRHYIPTSNHFTVNVPQSFTVMRASSGARYYEYVDFAGGNKGKEELVAGGGIHSIEWAKAHSSHGFLASYAQEPHHPENFFKTYRNFLMDDNGYSSLNITNTKTIYVHHHSAYQLEGNVTVEGISSKRSYHIIGTVIVMPYSTMNILSILANPPNNTPATLVQKNYQRFAAAHQLLVSSAKEL